MATGTSSGNELNVGQQSLENILPDKLPAKVLRDMTNNFSPQNIRGQSVYGTVFEGILQPGRSIAVERLHQNSSVPRDIIFDNVVKNLMALKHENVIKLVGYCNEKERSMMEHNGRYVIVDITEVCLCYEYVPKGPVDKYIYDETSKVGWGTRFKIIKGICKGLHFLHNELDEPLVHMNLVPTSIWLDDNFVPKIADFGQFRLFGEQQTQDEDIMNFKGHIGYVAPEYLQRGEISIMSDIYSLGMIILETTTGEKCSRTLADVASRKFVENIQKHWYTHGQIISKYPSLEQIGYDQVKACILIGLKCVEIDRKKRPSIVDIVKKLNGEHVKIFDKEFEE